MQLLFSTGGALQAVQPDAITAPGTDTALTWQVLLHRRIQSKAYNHTPYILSYSFCLSTSHLRTSRVFSQQLTVQGQDFDHACSQQPSQDTLPCQPPTVVAWNGSLVPAVPALPTGTCALVVHSCPGRRRLLVGLRDDKAIVVLVHHACTRP